MYIWFVSPKQQVRLRTNQSRIKIGERKEMSACRTATHSNRRGPHTHLELHHLAEALELRQDVVVELQEVLVELLLAVLQ